MTLCILSQITFVFNQTFIDLELGIWTVPNPDDLKAILLNSGALKNAAV